MSYAEHRAEVYHSADGWRFRIKASNGEIIAQGESYESKAGAITGVERVHPGITITQPQEADHEETS